MNVTELHKTLGELIAQGKGDANVLQANDPETKPFLFTNEVDPDYRYDADTGELGSAEIMCDRGAPAVILWS